jgi:hypothetical protein
MQAPVHRKRAGAEAYKCLLDNGRLMQGDTDVCLRSVNIQLYRVIEKENRDYKTCYSKTVKHIEMVKVLKCSKRMYVLDMLS